MAVVIDANNYIKRIYHGGGSPYGLALELLQKWQKETVYVVCDGPKSRNWRRSIYEKYKAGRNTIEDPVYWEVYNNIKELALHFGNAIVVEMLWGEADDYIRNTAKAGDIVISNDKDLWPLVEQDVTVLLNASTKVDLDLIETKFETRQPKFIDLYKALVGDPSDKIPGKRGFGKKAWKNFVSRQETYEKFLAGNFDDWPESVEMSWELARPYKGIDFKFIYGNSRDYMQWIQEKGIIL